MSLFSTIKNAFDSINFGVPAQQDVLSSYSNEKLATPSTPAVQRMKEQQPVPPQPAPSLFEKVSSGLNQIKTESSSVFAKVSEGLKSLNSNQIDYKAPPQQADIDINRLVQAESSGNPKASAIGRDNKTYVGLTGMGQAAWDEVNKIRMSKGQQNYDFKEATNPEINKEYASIYLNERVPQLLKSRGVEVTPQSKLAFYGGWLDEYKKAKGDITKMSKSARTYFKNVFGDTPQPTEGTFTEKPALLGKAANKISGVANTIYNKTLLPQTVNFVDEMLKGTARSAASIGQTVSQALPGGTDEFKTPDIPVLKQVSEFLFGKEAVPSLSKRIAEGEQEAASMGLPQNKDAAKSPAFLASLLFVGGTTALDFTPMGGEKQLAERLIKETSPEVISKLLKEVGVAEDLIPDYARAFSKAKTAEEVTKGLDSLKSIQDATKMAAEHAGNVSHPVEHEAAQYVNEYVNKRAEAKAVGDSGFMGKVKDALSTIKTKLVDFAAPIEDTLSKATRESGIVLKPSEDITNQIDRVLRAPTLAGQFIRDNGLDAIIREVPDLNVLDQYMIAKQAKRVAEFGIETGRDAIKDAKILEVYGPEYDQFAKRVTEYSHKLLDYVTEAGLIGKEMADKLKVLYPDYVPLQRVFNELEKSGGQFGSKAVASLSRQNIVKRLEGSSREIVSPIESFITKTNDAFVQAEKNKAARLLASYEKLPGNPFQLRELGAGESAPHTISYLENGVKKTFETSKEIADAAKAMNVQQLNILGKILAFPVRIARLGITGINLPFVASNIAKDQVSAFINSDKALQTSIANPKAFMDALYNAVGHGDLYQELVRTGGGGTSYDIARNQVEETVSHIRAGKSAGSKILYTVTHPSELLRAAENVIARSEELTRLQLYKGTKDALMKEGMAEGEAMIAAARQARQGTVNFARRGEWGTVLNSTFMYLNAGIQGTRTFLRNLKDKPLQTTAKLALTVFFPIATATAWNLSDPKRRAAYNDIPEYEKQGNIIIVPDNPTQDENGKWNVIKVPLSQEINNLGNIPRRMLEQTFGLDPVGFGDIAKALVGSVSPINPEKGALMSGLTPQAIRPTIEGVTNKSLFTGYPQVPASLEKVSPENKIKKNTSGTAVEIGKLTGMSPIKIEEFIKGTAGGVSSQVLNLSDRILAGLDIITPEQIHGTNVIDAIAARFSKAAGGAANLEADSKVKDLLMEQADENLRLNQEAELLYNELKGLPKDQANAKALALKQVDPELYDHLKGVVSDAKLGLTYSDRLIKQLQVKNGARAKFIWETLNSFKTPAEKNAYIEELKSKKIISEEVMKQLKELKYKQAE